MSSKDIILPMSEEFSLRREMMSLEQLFSEITHLRNNVSSLVRENRRLKESTRLLAHDIKTPLANLSFVLSELFDDASNLSLDPDTRTVVDLALRQLEKLQSALIETLIEPLHEQAARRKIQTDLFIQEILVLLSLPSTITVEFLGIFPQIYVFAPSLRGVFLNLLDNAAKAILPGHGKIKIESEMTSEGQWRCSVIDDGRGMSSELTETIFNPGKSSNRGNTRGFGIGLPATKWLVTDDLQGTLDVLSIAGHGTTFVITLPLTTSQ